MMRHLFPFKCRFKFKSYKPCQHYYVVYSLHIRLSLYEWRKFIVRELYKFKFVMIHLICRYQMIDKGKEISYV